MVFSATLFWTVLWHFPGEMYESEQMDFKNGFNTQLLVPVPNHAATSEKEG